MSDMTTVEAKAFVPARDFALSKQFYQDLGFVLAWSSDDLAYLRHGNSTFLLQNFYDKTHADNFMMHLLVQDVDAWWRHVQSAGIDRQVWFEGGAASRPALGHARFCDRRPDRRAVAHRAKHVSGQTTTRIRVLRDTALVGLPLAPAPPQTPAVPLQARPCRALGKPVGRPNLLSEPVGTAWRFTSMATEFYFTPELLLKDGRIIRDLDDAASFAREQEVRPGVDQRDEVLHKMERAKSKEEAHAAAHSFLRWLEELDVLE